MHNCSKTWVVPAAAVLLIAAVVVLTRKSANPTVQSIVDSISQTHYQKYHLDIENMGLGLYGGADYNMGYRNRDGWDGPGTLGNKEARLYIQDKFTAMGLNVSVQGIYLNVVGELPGTKTPENIYVIGSHYDHLEGDMPGGDDNASGTAGVLEAARVLSQYKFESTIRFICFNAEEDKQVGSKDYVNSHVIPNGEKIVGMINMDMILRPGSDANPNTVIDAEMEAQFKHPPSLAWAKAYHQAAIDYVPSLTVNGAIVDCNSISDNDAFLNNGYPAFSVIENSLPDFWEANSYYHKSDDASDRLANDPDSPSGVVYNFTFATDVTRTAVALLAQEAKPVQR
jgi:Zn-dependent M28 family amino/carboxypeptidase